MSVVVIITPVIIGGWPAFSALASAVATHLGFKLLVKSTDERERVSNVNEVELVDEKSQVLEESLRPEEELVFTRAGITITCKKDVREKFTICVRGEGKTDEELKTIGQTFLNRIKQQYAYQKVVSELTNRGFSLVEEETEGQRIRLTLRRF